MSWRIKPALGSIVVQPLQDETVTKTGIILVTTIEKESHLVEVKETCDPYEIDARTPGAVREGPVYKIGQILIIGKYNGRDVNITEEDGRRVRYIIIRESDVLGVIYERSEKPIDLWEESNG